MNNDELKNTFSLAIANIGVRLLCEDNILLQQLAIRYREFQMEAQVDLEVFIYLRDQKKTSTDYEVIIKYYDDVIQIKAPNYHGKIFIGQGVGEIYLGSTHPVEDIDYILRVIYAFLGYQAGGLLFHAAGIVHSRKAYLFFGHSGSGKTTVSRLSSKDIVLNDDLVLLMHSEKGWLVFATPFWNPTQVKPTPVSGPLNLMLRLVQDKEVFVETMGQGQALAEMVSCVPVISGISSLSGEMISRCEMILKEVPAYRLHFLPNETFWEVLDNLS